GVERHDLNFDFLTLVGIIARHVGRNVERGIHLVGVVVADLKREPVRLGSARMQRHECRRESGRGENQKGAPRELHRGDYLILPSRNSTCFFAMGSYFFMTSFSVLVREFFLVT